MKNGRWLTLLFVITRLCDLFDCLYSCVNDIPLLFVFEYIFVMGSLHRILSLVSEND